MPCRKWMLLVAFVSMLAGRPALSEEQADLTIADFETQEDLARWSLNGVKAELSGEHVTKGTKSARVTYLPGDGLKTFMLEIPWKRPLDLLKHTHVVLDIWAEKEVAFTFKLKSDQHQKQWFREYTAGPGTTTISVALETTGVNPATIHYLNLFMGGLQEETTIFLDNVRAVALKGGVPVQKQGAGEVLISDFETQEDLDRWQHGGSKTELSDEHATRGKRAAKVTYLEGAGGHVFMLDLEGKGLDLSKCTHLLMDVYAPVNLEVAVKLKSNQGKEVWQRDYSIEPAPWVISVPLGETGLDKAKLSYINLFIYNTRQEMVLFIDNVRGGKGGVAARPRQPVKPEKADEELF